jgi:transposase
MQLVLKKEEKYHLHSIYKNGDSKKREYAQVILLSADGWSVAKIASTLKLDPGVVLAHLAEYRNKHTQHQKSLKHSLDANQIAEFISHLEITPTISVDKMVEYLEQKYGIRVRTQYVESLIKAQGFSYQIKQVQDYYTSKTGRRTLVYRSRSGWYRNSKAVAASYVQADA